MASDEKLKPGEAALDWFWPPYLIDLFASQRTLVVGKSYDGAGTIRSITATPLGVIAAFDTAKDGKALVKRMLLSSAGWGWLAP
jgi:hypothetical protein